MYFYEKIVLSTKETTILSS